MAPFLRLIAVPAACLCAAFALGLLTGCSTASKKPVKTSKAVRGIDEQIFIGDTVEQNYDPNVILKRAESFFEKEEFHEAIVEYQHFLELHQAHILAPYAQFRLGESHVKLITTIDRDPSPVHKAMEAFEKLLRTFPGSKYHAQAEANIRECRSLIAKQHFMVGEFYYRREAYLAAAHRFESVLTEFGDQPAAVDALYYLASTYHIMGADDWAVEQLTVLAQRYPDHPYQSNVNRMLAEMHTQLPAPVMAEARPAGSNTTAGGSNGDRLETSSIASLSQVPGRNELPAATSVAPSHTPCRLGAWC